MYENKNKRHFEENFEDSEIETLNLNINPDNADTSLGQPIQLVRFPYYGGPITLDERALDIISSYDLPVGFVCLVGKYRTGKSFLLNKLLMLEGNGFRVDSSTRACTEGIWMWSKPIYNEQHGNYIFFLDSEGSASLNRDANVDSKIFTLATLISSYLIFNSVGAIDEKSINELNMVTQLSKNVILEDNADLRNNEENLYRFMPKFLWLLRDFILEPEDQYGRKLTSNQYLEDALFQQNTQIKSSEGSKKVRRSLLKFFKDRQCFTLVRPAKEQSDLQNLNYLPSYSLRSQFMQGVNKLRESIMKATGPKMYNETPLYGSSIAIMLESYVNTINNGGIPSIQTAWESINDDEGVFAYEKAIQQYNELYQENFQEEEPKGEQIHTVLRAIRQSSLSEFRKNITQQNEAYEQKLKQFFNENQDKIIKVNKQLIEHKNVQILKESTGMLMQNIQANAYSENPESLTADLNEAISEYNSRAKGENKGQILSQYLTLLNPIILGIQRSKSSQDNMKQYKEEEYEDTIKHLRDQIKTLERQLESNRNRMMQDPPNQKTTSKLSKKSKKKKNADSATCCGSGSCNIM